ncbi:MAG: ABC transporter substrate-binding protein [Bordetella sp.]|nr:ABC transporter substrate-binding protein [Bordetella sp.]
MEEDKKAALQRRTLLAAMASGLAALPHLSLAQQDRIRIGHLTPMTGFLGALGEYATQGIKMAVEEVNASGGVMGRQIELITEDSVNPQVAATKAQRMFERDNVVVLMGEISSASALTMSQVAARQKKLFMSIGARSDTLRGKDCNRYTFHVDIPVTVMVNTVGQALLRDNLVKGKKIFALTSDYVFGQDLSSKAKKFFAANGGNVVADELVPTDLTDFSPFMLKIRQARPDVVSTNLGGNQVTNFVKQYAEFGLPYPVVGFNLNTADAWAAGEGNLGGIWPTVWHHDLDTPGTKKFVADFTRKYNRIPENHAWIEYVSLKILAQAIIETKSTDSEKLIAYFESEAQFDVLKARKAYFRAWDHQLMQEAYPFTVKAKGESKGKQDFLKFGEALPAANQPLESLAPPKSENTCAM